MVREQLKRAAQALEADAAVGAEPAAADSDAAPAPQAGAGGATANKAQQRAKKADDYHGRHAGWVAQFNQLTHGECAGGAGGVKWAAVRAWQQKHWQLNNLLADGLVGPKTIEAAKLAAKKSAPKSDGDEKEGAGEKQHKEPVAGQADGAEAAVDKPKLDEESEEATDDQKVVDGAKPKAAKHKGSSAAFEDILRRIEHALGKFKTAQPAAAPPAAANGEKEAAPGKTPALDMQMPAPAALEKYEGVAQAMIDNWSSTSPRERCERLFAALNQALATEQIPQLLGWNETSSPTIAGQFHPKSWDIDLSKVAFATQTDNPHKLEAVKTVFHEGRHAHQRFTMARFLASSGQSATDIKRLLHLDPGVLQQAMQQAAQNPMDTNGAEAKAANAMVQDAGVHEKEHRATEAGANEILALGNEAADLYAALPDKAPFAQLWAEYARRMHEAIDAYHNLPTEHDAESAEKALHVHPSAK